MIELRLCLHSNEHRPLVLVIFVLFPMMLSNRIKMSIRKIILYILLLTVLLFVVTVAYYTWQGKKRASTDYQNYVADCLRRKVKLTKTGSNRPNIEFVVTFTNECDTTVHVSRYSLIGTSQNEEEYKSKYSFEDSFEIKTNDSVEIEKEIVVPENEFNVNYTYQIEPEYTK